MIIIEQPKLEESIRWAKGQHSIQGFVTYEKCVKGRALDYLEQILGYARGRLHMGVHVFSLLRLPTANEFDFRGYSQVADHHYADQFELNADGSLKYLDSAYLKRLLIEKTWQLAGPDSLVKMVPVAQHNNILSNDEQYPPGLGIPQWKIITPVPVRYVTTISDYPKGAFK
jgi:hypothetical protein